MSDTGSSRCQGAAGRASTGRNINDPGALAEVLGDDFSTVGEATLPHARMRARDVRVFMVTSRLSLMSISTSQATKSSL